MKKYSLQDVQKHNKPEDAWMVVDGWVLNVTQLFSIHPGGAQILEAYVGTDATDAFYSPALHYHSKDSLRTLSKFIVGYLEGAKTNQQVQEEERKKKTLQDFGVDPSKGLVWPIASLGEDYDELIRNVLVLSGPSLYYFDTPLLEFLTRSPWYTVPLFWVPIALWLWQQALQAGASLGMVLTLFLLCPLIWNFFEYQLHLHLFHMKPRRFVTRLIHFVLHGYHHLYPTDHLRLTFPPIPALLIASGIYYGAGIFLLPHHIGMGIMGAIISGYIYYDLMHYYLHHAPARFLWTSFLKTSHFYHHYKNENANYGISLWVFDYLFGTFDKTMMMERNKANKQN
uniref:Fatty acid 2-hydroxylase n=1 Tax=Arcella intermedia TaxID=1963864 RepID=A0A6B2L8X1_9EUKA